jgi:hypothetical protein
MVKDDSNIKLLIDYKVSKNIYRMFNLWEKLRVQEVKDKTSAVSTEKQNS